MRRFRIIHHTEKVGGSRKERTVGSGIDEKHVQHEVLDQHGLGWPTDNAGGVQVHDESQIETVFPCTYICDIPWSTEPYIFERKRHNTNRHRQYAGDPNGGAI